MISKIKRILEILTVFTVILLEVRSTRAQHTEILSLSTEPSATLLVTVKTVHPTTITTIAAGFVKSTAQNAVKEYNKAFLPNSDNSKPVPQKSPSIDIEVRFEMNIAVPYDTVVDEVVGSVDLPDKTRNPTHVSTAIIMDPRTDDIVGEIRAFEVTPYTGEIYTKVLMLDFNQKRLKFNVTMVDSSTPSLLFNTEITVWVYDSSQEIEVVLQNYSPAVIGKSLWNLSQELSSLFGSRVALGKIAGITVGGETQVGSVIKFVVIDTVKNKVDEALSVITAIDQSSVPWRWLQNKYGIRKIQVTETARLRLEVSLAGIILIAICSLLLVSIVFVLCIFYHMRRRHKLKALTLVKGLQLDYELPSPINQQSHNHACSAPVTTPVPYVFGSSSMDQLQIRNSNLEPRILSYEEQEFSISVTSEPETTLPRSPILPLSVPERESDSPGVGVLQRHSAKREVYF